MLGNENVPEDRAKAEYVKFLRKKMKTIKKKVEL